MLGSIKRVRRIDQAADLKHKANVPPSRVPLELLYLSHRWGPHRRYLFPLWHNVYSSCPLLACTRFNFTATEGPTEGLLSHLWPFNYIS